MCRSPAEPAAALVADRAAEQLRTYSTLMETSSPPQRGRAAAAPGWWLPYIQFASWPRRYMTLDHLPNGTKGERMNVTAPRIRAAGVNPFDRRAGVAERVRIAVTRLEAVP